jgi:hypothetical protein
MRLHDANRQAQSMDKLSEGADIVLKLPYPVFRLCFVTKIASEIARALAFCGIRDTFLDARDEHPKIRVRGWSSDQ